MSETSSQPGLVIKDVQTLKANLQKEQEKRARSDDQNVGVDGVLPAAAGTDQQEHQPPVGEAHDGQDAGVEKRKRRKVSSTSSPTKNNGTPADVVLDGPLPPPTNDNPHQSSDHPNGHITSAPKDPISASPVKAGESQAPNPQPTAAASTVDGTDSATVPPSSEPSNDPVTSQNNDSKAAHDPALINKTVDKPACSEALAEGAGVAAPSSEAKEDAAPAEMTNKPAADAVEVAAS